MSYDPRFPLPYATPATPTRRRRLPPDLPLVVVLWAVLLGGLLWLLWTWIVPEILGR